MYLLIRATKHHKTGQLVKDFDTAVSRARDHVGEHYPADGCSTPPNQRFMDGKRGKEFQASRNTSFGIRGAIVRPISDQFEVELF